jgi:hypothetical protein
MITRIRLAAAVLTFLLGLAGVWLTNLGSQLTDATLEWLMPTPTLESPPVGAESSELDADTYAVYDVLLNDTAAAKEGRLLIIQSETSGWRDDNDANFEQFTRPAPFLEYVSKSLPEAESGTLWYYLAVNRERQELKNIFQLKTNYLLVTDDELKSLAGGRELVLMWPTFYQKYGSDAALYGLSRVGFNPEHTQAFVYFWHACGDTCGSGSYVLLEKSDGTWREVKRMGLWLS